MSDFIHVNYTGSQIRINVAQIRYYESVAVRNPMTEEYCHSTRVHFSEDHFVDVDLPIEDVDSRIQELNTANQ